MICCKIIADYENPNADFGGALKKLSEHAEILWEGGYLYLGEINSDFLSEKKIIRILKANKYTKFFVDIYSKDNQPNETEFVNGWLTDKLIRINYNQYEKDNHQMLVNTMKGLEILNEEVDCLLKKQQEEGENSGTKNEEKGS